jgi:type IV pilus assembly protein PilO
MRFGLREVIFLVVLLVVPLASYLYVFKPRNAEIKLARTDIDAKQAKLNKLKEVSEKIDDINIAIEQGRAAIRLVEAKLPSAMEVDVILKDIWQIAASADLAVKTVKSEKPVESAGYMEQPLQVVMQGRFEGFYNFLMQLENLPRITRIHKMKLERAAKKGNDEDVAPDDMKADFVLSIYYEQAAESAK